MTKLRRISGDIRRFGQQVLDDVRTVRATAVTAVEQVPETADAARAGALDTAVAMQRLPNSTLQWLAATSVGLGTGFFLSGAPRVVPRRSTTRRNRCIGMVELESSV